MTSAKTFKATSN